MKSQSTKLSGKVSSKSQSAMEYLMTYGWAILIIAVVLGVLFQMGVFSGSALTPKAPPGACTVERLAGQVSLEGECQGQLPKYVAYFATSDPTCSGQPCYGGAIVIGSPSSYSTLLNPTQQVSVTAWVHIDGGTGWQRVVQNTHTSTAGYWLDDYYQEGATTNGRFCVNSTMCAQANYAAHRWVFLTGTFNGLTVSLYANASQIVSVSYATPTPISTDTCAPIIGGDAGSCNGNGNFFNGSIANVQIYNTSLSQAEVTALYQEGIGGAPIRIQNLVGWWPLDGNAQDYSGNDNNGQAYNGVAYNGSWGSTYTPL
jgi:hypothetical protein